MFTPREPSYITPEVINLTNSLEKSCISLLTKQNDSLVHLKQIKHILDQFPRRRSWTNHSMVISSVFCYLTSAQATELTWETREAFVNTLSSYFDIALVDQPGLFSNVYSFLVRELYDHVESNIRQVPEEYKLAVVLCIVSLLKALSTKCQTELYDKKFCQRHGTLVWSCLEMAKKEKLRELRIQCLNAIMAIASVLDDQTAPNSQLKSEIADMFMHFLPGISVSLPQIAAEDAKLGHRIICSAIKCWARIVHLVMQTYDNSQVEKRFDLEELDEILKLTDEDTKMMVNTKQKWKSAAELDAYIKDTARHKNWFRKTDKSLCLTVRSFFPLCQHQHVKVRLELAEVFAPLLKDCYRTIPETLAKLVVILLTLSGDEDPSVSSATGKVLKELTYLEEKDACYYKNLFDCLEELFYTTVNTLPNSFYNFDDDKKYSAVSLVCGFLEIFRVHRIESLINNHAQLRQLISSLVFVCELEKLNINVYEEYSIEDFDVTDRRSPWKVFKHFRDPKIKRKIWQILELLCTSSVINVTLNYIQEVFNTDIVHRKEATLILNGMISRISSEKEREYFGTTVIESYLDPANFGLPIEANFEVTLSEAHNNVIQVCLYLEGIGKIAGKLGKYTEKLLMKILYPIIEKAGSVNPLIRLAGMRTLHSIALACQCKNIAELICQNTDYLSFSINRKFKRFSENPEVLNVFTVCMRLSTVDALPSLMSIIEETLFDTCDTSHSTNPKAFLRIFDTFTKCLTRWFGITSNLSPIKSKAERLAEVYKERDEMLAQETDFSDSVLGKTAEEMYREDMEKYEREKRNFEGTGDIDSDDDDGYPIMEEIKKAEVPKWIKLTTEALKRTVHTLGSKDDNIKLLSLGILTSGLEILRGFDDELLPIVHQIWSPLVQRLKNGDDVLIFHHSYVLLVTMAKLSGTFIRNRFIKDAKNLIVQTLMKRSKDSFLKDRGSAYRLSQGYKLQVAILGSLARLVTDVELCAEELGDLFEGVGLYLEAKQPKPLQDLSVDFFKAIALYDPELVKGNEKYFSVIL